MSSPPPSPEQVLYDFKVEFFNAYPTYENWQNVIFNVFWSLTGVYDDGTKLYEFTLRRRTNVDTSGITDFVPYEQLTEAMVIDWINSSSSGPTIDETKQIIYNQIYTQVNPPPPTSIILPPPW